MINIIDLQMNVKSKLITYMICTLLIFILFSLTISCHSVNADEYSSRIRYFSVNDGLPQQVVTSLVQDRRGFMWLGTYDGLCKFDGIAYKNYYHINNNSASLTNNRILSILEDSKGNLFVGTEGSPCLNLYNKDIDNFFRFSNSDWKDCRCLVEDAEHRIWMGTSHGVWVLRFDSLRQLTYEQPDINNLCRAVVKRILMSPDGQFVWLLTDKRIYHLNIKYELIECYDDEMIDGVEDIYCDSSSRLFVLHEAGLYLADSGNLVKTNVGLSFMGMKELRNGVYLAGTNGHGLYMLQHLQNGFFKVDHADEMSRHTFFQSNLIRNFFVDRQNCLWIGSSHDGAAIIDQTPYLFSKLTIPKEEVRPFIRVITKDSANNLWIGVKLGGLYMLKDGKYTKFPIATNQDFNAIMEDSRKRIWILTNKNVYVYKEQRLFNLTDIPGVPTDIYEQILAASAIVEDNNGAIWIGGTGQFVRIKGLFTSDVSFHYYNTSYTEGCFCMDKDSEGRIWLGTRSNGLFVMTLNTSSEILKVQSLNTRGNQIWDICFSKSGKWVWVATDSGLDSFGYSSLEPNAVSLDAHEKLINHKVLNVTEVDDGSIWLNTSQGLLHYNPQTKYYREYYNSDGLCSSCLTDAGCLAADGTLYVGSVNGINYFNPLEIKEQRRDVQIQITSLKIHNQTVMPNQKINGSIPLKHAIMDVDNIYISYRNNNFSFEFTAPRFISPKKIYYAYKLQGVDDDWVYTTSDNRVANYNNISAGKYVFLVKATDINGIWDTPEWSVVVIVGKAPWNTWWAYLLYAALIILIVTLLLKHYFLRYKLKRDLQIANLQRDHEQVLNEMKLQFHANVSHEIRTSLALVITPLNDIISEMGDMMDVVKLSIIRRNIDHLNNLVSQFLDLQKTDKGAMPLYVKETNIFLLLDEVCARFRPLAEKQLVKLELICDSCDLVGYLDEDKVVKIVSNLISNAIKFNQAGGRVTVFAALVNDEIELAVEDTGCGISADDITHIFERYYQNSRRASQGLGIGLSLVNQLVKLHRGNIGVKSIPDGGQTLFTVRIPVSKESYEDKELIQEKYVVPTACVVGRQELEAKATIMIVEDNLDMCAYLETCLSKQFNVICKCHVDEAIVEIVKSIPDLILSDVNFEGDEKTGYDLCDAVKGNIMTNHIPILMLSAKDTPQDIALGYSHGAEDYILKPFSMEILSQKISNIIMYRQNQLLDQGRNHELKDVEDDSQSSNPFYDKLIALIQENISNSSFGITDICDGLNVSRTQLYRKMKSITDMPISTLIRNYRIEKAYELLKENDYTISEVMYQVGISSNSYFTKIFKEYYNIAPSAFVKQSHNK